MKKTWTHPQCDCCWAERNPADRIVYRFNDPVVETCAWCGQPTRSGIYVREDPDLLPYPAEHET